MRYRLLVENGRLAAPVGVFASMDDDGGEMLPLGICLGPVVTEGVNLTLSEEDKARVRTAANTRRCECELCQQLRR